MKHFKQNNSQAKDVGLDGVSIVSLSSDKPHIGRLLLRGAIKCSTNAARHGLAARRHIRRNFRHGKGWVTQQWSDIINRVISRYVIRHLVDITIARGQSKITQFDIAFRVQKYIGWFQISVNDIMRM